MNGKSKCRILKQIRKNIADNNEIPYEISECKFKGDCKGTCPKCDAELKALSEEIENRRRLGKKVALVGLSAALVSNLASCGISDFFRSNEALEGDMLIPETQFRGSEKNTVEILPGDIPPASETESEEIPRGEPGIENESAIFSTVIKGEIIPETEAEEITEEIRIVGEIIESESESEGEMYVLEGDIAIIADEVPDEMK